MSGEKTEKPTEKRLFDARKKGQAAKSQDLTSALMLISIVIIFWLGGKFLAANLLQMTQKGIETAGAFSGELTRERASDLLYRAAIDFSLTLAPLFIFLFIGAIVFNYVQTGSIFAFEHAKPDVNRLNPAVNFKQIFLKSRSYLGLGKILLKLILALIVVGSVLYGEIPNLVRLVEQPAAGIAAFLFGLLLRTGFYVGILFLGLAIGDFFLQRFLFLNQMKMSKQEVGQENKESEGDPLVKWVRKNSHREILAQNFVEAVKTADVVVINPAHIAVVLKYDREKMSAPRVVAKGAELIAKQIREIAKESDVPVMRDVSLGRKLYELEIDAEIPEEMYEPVAEVLRWAYLQKEENEEN